MLCSFSLLGENSDTAMQMELSLVNGKYRGKKRVVINQDNGEMYLTGDHYNTMYYAGCVKPPNKCRGIDEIRKDCSKPEINCVVDPRFILGESGEEILNLLR